MQMQSTIRKKTEKKKKLNNTRKRNATIYDTPYAPIIKPKIIKPLSNGLESSMSSGILGKCKHGFNVESCPECSSWGSSHNSRWDD